MENMHLVPPLLLFRLKKAPWSMFFVIFVFEKKVCAGLLFGVAPCPSDVCTEIRSENRVHSSATAKGDFHTIFAH